MLEERRQEIVDKLRTIRETMPDQRLDVQDAEEQAVTDFAKDMEFALVQMKADTLGRIDEAMRRLEAGTLRRVRGVRDRDHGRAPQGPPLRGALRRLPGARGDADGRGEQGGAARTARPRGLTCNESRACLGPGGRRGKFAL